MTALGGTFPLLGSSGLVSGDGFFATDAPLAGTARYEDVFTVTKRYAVSSAFGIGMAPAQTPLIRPGRIISEIVHMQLTATPTFRFGWTIDEQLHMHDALRVALPTVLNAGIGIAPALTASIAVTVLQGLGIAATPIPSAKYALTLLQGLGMSDAFRNFFGGGLSDGIGMHEALSRQFTAHPVVSEGIGIAPALSNHFYIRATLSDTIELDDANILNAIYTGKLADGIEISIGYVSPDGQFTTWAMNTRTGAVTEYTNFAFNSFAQIGNKCFGGSSTGLYSLIGDDDAGDDIVAQIKSGFAEWGSSKFTMFKAVYLGARGGGDYVLKLTTGDGHTYNYGVSARDMRTTKINVGKGIRTRYFAFELISTGQDFDLDTIEFVPLIAARRV